MVPRESREGQQESDQPDSRREDAVDAARAPHQHVGVRLTCMLCARFDIRRLQYPHLSVFAGSSPYTRGCVDAGTCLAVISACERQCHGYKRSFNRCHTHRRASCRTRLIPEPSAAGYVTWSNAMWHGGHRAPKQTYI